MAQRAKVDDAAWSVVGDRVFAGWCPDTAHAGSLFRQFNRESGMTLFFSFTPPGQASWLAFTRSI